MARLLTDLRPVGAGRFAPFGAVRSPAARLRIGLVALVAGLLFAWSTTGLASADALTDSTVLDGQLAQSQILNGDLTVESGETIESDVSVYSGDVRVKDGARIDGTLLVYSGDVTIEEGGIVAGDITAFSGDVEVEGEVRGDIASWSGDIKLDDTAVIGGDISVLSGEIKRSDGALVGGNLVRGPTLNFAMPGFGDNFQFDGNPPNFGERNEAAQAYGRISIWDRIGRFFLNLVFGGLLALLFTGLTALLVYAKSDYVTDIGRNIREQTAVSFVVGLATSLVLTFLAICGIPLLILLALGFVGWAAFALLLGTRIARGSGADWTPVVAAMIGAVVLSLLLVPLWSLGGCFRFLVGVGLFLANAVGVGAVVLPWLNRARGSDTPPPQMIESEAPLSDTASSGRASSGVVPEDISASSSAADSVPEDDFTQIDGIGQIFDARLKVAGVRTFSQLAALSAEEIGAIIDWPIEQVQMIDVAGQAAMYAERNG